MSGWCASSSERRPSYAPGLADGTAIVISGATRGAGGRALSRHLTKAEAEQKTRIIAPRGIVSRSDLHAQLAELVAGSAHGRTDRPCYHVHCDPALSNGDSQEALAAWWEAFETEFQLQGQPYVGAQHEKHSRLHEHRVYGVVKPDGGVVDLSWDYLRRTYVNICVAHRLGHRPAPTPHAKAVAARLSREDRHDVVAWMAGHALFDGKRPVASLSPAERLIEERTGVGLRELRRAVLEAWSASVDGAGLQRQLAKVGLSLRAGTHGTVVVDKAGAAHSLTRLVGAASREAGTRIRANIVKDRVAELCLQPYGEAHGRSIRRNPRRGPDNASHARRVASSSHAGGDGRRSGEGFGVRAGGDRRRLDQAGGRDRSSALGGLRSASPARRFVARTRLTTMLRGVDWNAVHDAGDLAERLRMIAEGARRAAWVTGMTDLWGIPVR